MRGEGRRGPADCGWVDTGNVSFGTDGDEGDDLEPIDVGPPKSASVRKVANPSKRLIRSCALIAVLAAGVGLVFAVAVHSDRRTSPRASSALPPARSTIAALSTIPEPVVVEVRLRPGEQRCPADRDLADSLAHATVAEMTRRGAADGLPEDGATTRDRVAAAVRLNAASIRNTHRGVIAVTVGRGVGWTYSQSADSLVAYHSVKDFQVVVHLRRKASCPQYASFVSNDRGQRVPSLFVYESTP